MDRIKSGSFVAVASLGGTITMVPRADGAGMAGELSAADLIGQAGLGGKDVIATTLLELPSASLSYQDVLDCITWADEQAAEAVGIVVAQGTDTMEESAYLADLLWDRPQPLVFTGAMRGAAHISADGPANLVAAIAVARSEEARGRGVMVVLDDKIHPAARVRKQHSFALDAFESPDGGPVGTVVEGMPHFALRTPRRRALAVPTKHVRVVTLDTYLGDDATMLAAALDADIDGIVVSAFGAGHVPSSLLDLIDRALDRMPVVIASRTAAGGTLSASYGFRGSETDLSGRGAILAGLLDARKARILLATLLGSDADPARIRTQFALHGRRF